MFGVCVLLTRDGVQDPECPVQPGGEGGGPQHVGGGPGEEPALGRQHSQQTRVTADVAEVLVILPARVHPGDWRAGGSRRADLQGCVSGHPGYLYFTNRI